MALTKDWRDLPVELAPTAGETLAEHNARIAAYDLANPGVLTFLSAVALEDLEMRAQAEISAVRINVKAAGDGDNTAAIAAALAGAGTVWLEDGIHTVEGLDVPASTRLTGSKKAIIRRKAGATGTRCIGLAAGARIDGFSVDGNELNQTAVSNTIELVGSRATVRDIDVYDSPYHPIAVRENAHHCTVEGARIYKVNSAFSAARHGINVLGNSVDATGAPEHTLITNCHVQDTTLSNIAVDAGKWTSIINNKCERSGAAGDGVVAYTWWNEHTLIAGNTFRDNDNHFVHAGGNHVTLVGNHGENAGTEGYFVASSPNTGPTPSVNCHVASNTAIKTRTLGGGSGSTVRVERYTDVSIGSGLHRDANLGGFNVVDCQNVSVYPGLIKGLGNGIRLAGCKDVAINGGVIRSNSGTGLLLISHTRADTTVVETEDVEVNGTLIKGNTGWGVLSQNATARVTINAVVRGNTAGNISLAGNRTTHCVAPGKSDTTANIASAAMLTVVPDCNFFNVTGTADITSVTTSWSGREIALKFAGTAATNGVVDGSNLKLAGNFAYTPDDVLRLVCDGTNWYEVGRSTN